MPLIEIPKEHLREPRKVSNGPEIPPSTIIRYYVGRNDKRINNDLIIEILESIGIDVGGNVIHKVRLSNNVDLYVDDAGKALLLV